MFDACLLEYAHRKGRSHAGEHFYERTLARRRQRAFEVLGSDALFAEYSYAALATWVGREDLVAFDLFRETLSHVVLAVTDLANLSLLDLDHATSEYILPPLVHLCDTTRLTTAQPCSLIATAKLLHVLLPDLVPPIDRRHTLTFLFGSAAAPHGSAPSELFRIVFGTFVHIGSKVAPSIRNAVDTDPTCCPGHAKVIDNAIIGFVESQ